jgi:hypothetical protein
MIWLSILQERQGNLPDFGVEHISTPIERSLSDSRFLWAHSRIEVIKAFLR